MSNPKQWLHGCLISAYDEILSFVKSDFPHSQVPYKVKVISLISHFSFLLSSFFAVHHHRCKGDAINLEIKCPIVLLNND